MGIFRKSRHSKPDKKSRSNLPLHKRIWREWILPSAIIIGVIFTFRSAVADWNDVPTQSMEPTILVGDRIFVNKLAYDLKIPFTSLRLARWSDPRPGDIVVFFSPKDGKRMVKRVAAVPGDVVEMKNNKLFINGVPVAYQPLSADAVPSGDLEDRPPHEFKTEQLGDQAHAIMLQPTLNTRRKQSGKAHDSYGPKTVPADHFFLVGDNRDNSGDSRVFGFVERDQIVGKAVGLAFSFEDNDILHPRWERFCRGID